VQQARANKAKGGQKNKFVDPNNNLQELEGENQTTQSTITTTQSNPDDKWLEDEDKGGFIFSQNTNQNAKPQKKNLRQLSNLSDGKHSTKKKNLRKSRKNLYLSLWRTWLKKKL